MMQKQPGTRMMTWIHSVDAPEPPVLPCTGFEGEGPLTHILCHATHNTPKSPPVSVCSTQRQADGLNAFVGPVTSILLPEMKVGKHAHHYKGGLDDLKQELLTCTVVAWGAWEDKLSQPQVASQQISSGPSFLHKYRWGLSAWLSVALLFRLWNTIRTAWTFIADQS